MPVIPFYRENNTASYTSTNNEFYINGEVILIQDLDETQLQENNRNGNATYNFRIGHQYKSYNDKDITAIQENGEIYITPGGTIVVQTLEYVHFPSTRYGLILPRVSLLQRGLSTVASKIDPGYKGNLAITIFNHSRITEKLIFGDQFCSLTLFSVSSPSKPYDKAPKNIQGQEKGFIKRAKDFISRYVAIFTFINTIIIISYSLSRTFGIYEAIENFLSR